MSDEHQQEDDAMAQEKPPSGWAAASTVDRIHTENKGAWQKHHQDHDLLERKVERHGWQLEQVEQRLNRGAEEFTQIKTKLDAKPFTWKTWLGMATGAAVFCGGLIWQAARYPDPDSFKNIQERVQKESEETDKKLQQMRLDMLEQAREFDHQVQQLKLDQLKMGNDIQSTLQTVQGKLDRVLDGK